MNPDTIAAYKRLKKMVCGNRQYSREARLKVVADLKATGYNLPAQDLGAAIAEQADLLAKPDVILIGSAAFETYCGMRGLISLPPALVSTKDVDIAYAGAIEKQKPPPQTEANDFMRKASNGVALDFIVPETITEEIRRGAPHWRYVPGLNSYAHIIPGDRRLLLIDPIQAVVVHDAGIAVTVPHPLRFALHKLVVAASRPESRPEKSTKDRRQALLLLNHYAPLDATDKKIEEIAEQFMVYRDGMLKPALVQSLEPIIGSLRHQAADWLKRGEARAAVRMQEAVL